MQSFVFDFEKSPTFFKKWNKEFDVEDIGTNCFYIVLVDDICDDNISDVLNLDGQIKYSSDHLLSTECNLTYNEIDVDTAEIKLNGSVDIDFDDLTIDDFDMKGCFLTNDAGYVIGYSINTRSLNISNEFILEDGLVFFTLVRGLYGE